MKQLDETIRQKSKQAIESACVLRTHAICDNAIDI